MLAQEPRREALPPPRRREPTPPSHPGHFLPFLIKDPVCRLRGIFLTHRSRIRYPPRRHLLFKIIDFLLKLMGSLIKMVDFVLKIQTTCCPEGMHCEPAKPTPKVISENKDTDYVRFLLKNLYFPLKNLYFLLKDVDFLLKNVDFLLKNVHVIIKTSKGLLQHLQRYTPASVR